MNVQDLLYDHAVKAELCFKNLLTSENCRHDFVLCILCSIEKEDRSLFATAFNRHKKNVPLEINLDEKLRVYLTDHFKSCEKSVLNSIDKDGLNVRVITSEQSSVGKSLHVKRQIEKARDIEPDIKSNCISIKKQTLPFECVFKELKNFNKLHVGIDSNLEKPEELISKILHVDIAYEVWYDVDYFLFNLLCLGKIFNFYINPGYGHFYKSSFLNSLIQLSYHKNFNYFIIK